MDNNIRELSKMFDERQREILSRRDFDSRQSQLSYLVSNLTLYISWLTSVAVFVSAFYTDSGMKFYTGAVLVTNMLVCMVSIFYSLITDKVSIKPTSTIAIFLVTMVLAFIVEFLGV